MNELLIFGIAAPLWMLIGVAWVASRFPGYSHKTQVMSELGAISRPTQRIQPLVNNYPIGILFSIFGVGLLLAFPGELTAIVTGILIVSHGASHIVAGIFPCDADLGVENPSPAQKLHNIAGLVMYLSLLAACIVWALPSTVAPYWFRWYSLGSAVVSIVFVYYMARALNGGRNIGLYQRLSYGILASWSAVFSAVLIWV